LAEKEAPLRLEQLSTILAAIAIGGAMVLYVKVDRLEEKLLSARAEPREGLRSIDAEGASGARDRGSPAPADETTYGSATAGAPREALAANDASGEPGPAASLEERIARLEQKSRTEPRIPFFNSSQRYAGTVDDLAKQLSLTETQRARVEDAIARGRARIEDILKIPDETGKSPYERRAEARKRIEEAMKNPPQEGHGLLAFATDMMSHRDRKIPGRGETYSDAIERVRKETREEVSNTLDSKQRETFQQTNTDALMGEASQVSFAYALGNGHGEGQGDVVVEMGTSIDMVTGDEEIPPPPAPPEGDK
jgi:hypothetical protein